MIDLVTSIILMIVGIVMIVIAKSVDVDQWINKILYIVGIIAFLIGIIFFVLNLAGVVV